MLKKISLLFLLLIMTIGCASSQSSDDSSANSGDSADYDVAESEAYSEEAVYERAAGSVAQKVSAQAAESPAQERVIIRNGYIEIVVTDPEGEALRLGRQAEALGGWVVESNLSQSYNDDTRKRATITLRVPSASFQEVVDSVKQDALDIVNETTSGRDVTDEFVDLSARLDNLQATEARVQTFLDDARTVSQALEVNQELSRLQGEIEVITGRLKYLRESADFSSITVTLVPDSDVRPIQIASWRPQGTARNAVEFLFNFLQWLADVAIWLVIVGLPLLVLLLLLRWLVRRIMRAFGWTRPTFRPRNRAETETESGASVGQ